MSKIYCFRHAQASLGSDNYDQLSKKGETQALQLGIYLCEKKIKFDKIYVGTLRRQQHTCEIVAEQYIKNGLDFPKPIILEGLNEHQATEAMKSELPKMLENDTFLKNLFKEVENDSKKRITNLMLGFKYFLHKWINKEITVNGIIPWDSFRSNVKKALKAIFNQTKKSEQIAIFSSGGTISSIVGESLEISKESIIADLNFSVRNTSFSTFFYSNNEFNLMSFNELPHLKEDMVTFV